MSTPPLRLVVMGVSGCGKSTMATALRARTLVVASATVALQGYGSAAVEAAHLAAQALVRRGRDSDDPKVTKRLVKLADEQKLRVVTPKPGLVSKLVLRSGVVVVASPKLVPEGAAASLADLVHLSETLC